ncbi:MAG: 8-amino-7-oxononanoate synthase [Gammaproteobacteria bacterium]|nr:8-amino-7-oxononanoate synthase [Gammaproteobacteria bacterium]
MIAAEAALAAALEERRRAGLYRSRSMLDSAQGTEVRIDGQTLLAFCSNDYLGLANHPNVVAALKDGANRYGVGSGASHLVSGHSRVHEELETALARFTGRPRALLFSTGYMANVGVVSALMTRKDQVLHDRLNHASLLDATRMAGARLRRFPHLDTDTLAGWLEDDPTPGRLIATDGIFSMDGDLANLPELAKLAQRYEAWLMVDDAHAFGVIGESGAGSCERWGLSADEVPILIGTLGKAFGTFGAFVAGSEVLIETLIQSARSYIYTTALPPAVAYATLASLELIRNEPWRRTHLAALSQRLIDGARALGFEVMGGTDDETATPIVPLILGTPEAATSMSRALLEHGILVGAIRPPTVPAGTARLRITLSAAHTDEQVSRLLEALAECR